VLIPDWKTKGIRTASFRLAVAQVLVEGILLGLGAVGWFVPVEPMWLLGIGIAFGIATAAARLIRQKKLHQEASPGYEEPWI
jgi:hypothetical protein